MKKALVVNAGSSSLKWQLYDGTNDEVLAKGIYERIGLDGVYSIEVEQKIEEKVDFKDHKEAVDHLIQLLIKHELIKDISEINGIGHRVVQGGDKYRESILIDDNVENGIAELIQLAPLHNPGALQAIKAFRELLNVPNVAVFDTSFHRTIAPEKFIYPVPYEWYQKYKVRRYGFHGISHQYITEKYKELENKVNPNLIICHIGNGASVTAVKDGESFNTSMGLTPLDGLMMGTRSGNIDPGIIEYMAGQLNKTASEVVTMLNKESGILGLSQKSSDMRDLMAMCEAKNEQALLAFEIFCQKIADYVAMYFTQLNGKVDALVFTAGIGENASEVRQSVVDKVSALGFKIDKELNAQRNMKLSNEGIPVLRIPTNEELMILKELKRIGQ